MILWCQSCQVSAEMADIKDIHVPSGAVLCWRRIPTETSGRSVRESDQTLLGRANGCWMTAVTVSSASACIFRVTNDAHETQCLHKDGTMRVSAWKVDTFLFAPRDWNTESVATWNEISDWKCLTVHRNIFKRLNNEMCIERVFRTCMIQSRYSHRAAFLDFCHWKNRCWK